MSDIKNNDCNLNIDCDGWNKELCEKSGCEKYNYCLEQLKDYDDEPCTGKCSRIVGFCDFANDFVCCSCCDANAKLNDIC